MSADPRTQFEFVEEFWQQLLELDARRGRKIATRAAKRRMYRTLALALLGLVAAAGIAAAAATWIFGSAAPVRISSAGSQLLGPSIAGSDRLLVARAGDPEGGPGWGLRSFHTSRHAVCLQVGRIVDGRLVALGVAGAFGNDSKAHALAVETEACGTLESDRPTRFGAVSQVRSASGLIGPCSPPACTAGQRRTIVFGLLGRRARQITLILGDRRLRSRVAQRAYLFVLEGDVDVGDARFVIADRHGRKCEMANPAASLEQRRNQYKTPVRPRCDAVALT